MKLVLFLLVSSTCALLSLSGPVSFDPSSTQYVDYQLSPQSRANLLDVFQSFVSNIIEEAGTFIRDYADKAANIINVIQKEVDGLSALVNSTVNNITNDYEKLLLAWQKESELAYNCSLKYGPLIVDAVNKTQQDIGACIQNASQAAEDIKNSIEKNIDELLGNVKQLQSLVDDCFKNSTNIFQGISCVVGKGNDIKNNILQIVAEIKTILSTATSKGIDIVKTTGKCLNTAADNYQQDVLKLQIAFKNCVLDGFW